MSQSFIRKAAGFGLAKRFWYSISEPRLVNLLAWIGYWFLTLGATTAMIHPPQSVQNEWGGPTMYSVAFLVLLGGIIGLTTALRGWWFLERWGVIALLAGGTLYSVLIIAMQAVGTGNRLFQLGFILYILTSLVRRLIRVMKRPLDPSVPSREPLEAPLTMSPIELPEVPENPSAPRA